MDRIERNQLSGIKLFAIYRGAVGLEDSPKTMELPVTVTMVERTVNDPVRMRIDFTDSDFKLRNTANYMPEQGSRLLSLRVFGLLRDSDSLGIYHRWYNLLMIGSFNENHVVEKIYKRKNVLFVQLKRSHDDG